MSPKGRYNEPLVEQYDPPQLNPAPGDPANGSPSAPAHRAPPPGWRPMSGIALTAFILSILIGLATLFTGLWWMAVLPLALGIWGMRRAVPTHFRGRGFAIAAVVLSIFFGAFALFTTMHLVKEVKRMTAELGRIMSADRMAPEEQRRRLNEWIHDRVVDQGIAEAAMERFKQVEAELGEYQGAEDPASIMSGMVALMLPPSDPNLYEAGDKTRGVPGFAPEKMALWGRMRFERGTAYVGMFLYSSGGKPAGFQDAMTEGGSARIFSDIRFYIPPGGSR